MISDRSSSLVFLLPWEIQVSISDFKNRRRPPRQTPNGRSRRSRKNPRHRDRGPRHPRWRAYAHPRKSKDLRKTHQRMEGRYRPDPPPQRLPPRPPLHQRPRPGCRLHGNRSVHLPGRPAPQNQPGLSILPGPFPEAKSL